MNNTLLINKDLFGDNVSEPVKKLSDWFVVPPFSSLKIV